ncbi:MAG: alpha/beta hydrolase [Gemmatimonadaceae bacterium]
MSRTVMLIHGAWLTPASWDQFRGRYEALGFRCVAPAWPLMDRSVEALRRAPHKELSQLSISRIVEHYAQHVRALPEAPILVGHSFGGLMVQLLLDRGLGTAGVAIDPAPPRGVIPGLTTLRTSLPVFTTWNAWNKVLTMSFEDFASGFANGVPVAERRATYDRQIVPAPGRIFWQAALGIQNGVNYRNPNRAPLLVIAGEDDRTVQPSMVRAAYRKHQRSSSPTAFKEFAGRSHFLCGEPGWEEVADYALNWARSTERVERREIAVDIPSVADRATPAARPATAATEDRPSADDRR